MVYLDMWWQKEMYGIIESMNLRLIEQTTDELRSRPLRE